MRCSIELPTRHTDTFGGTGFVHAGVLLALTELAYAAAEKQAGLSKPEQIVSVQVRTRAEYLQPLRWQEGTRIEVRTLQAGPRGFTQAFDVRSAASDRLIARIEHDWVWLDTSSGRSVPLNDEVQAALLTLGEAAG